MDAFATQTRSVPEKRYVAFGEFNSDAGGKEVRLTGLEFVRFVGEDINASVFRIVFYRQFRIGGEFSYFKRNHSFSWEMAVSAGVVRLWYLAFGFWVYGRSAGEESCSNTNWQI